MDPAEKHGQRVFPIRHRKTAQFRLSPLPHFKPIAHLYKTQVYQLAEHLGIPEQIRRRPPTTDTYSLAQSQEEFFFALPYRQMDLCLYGKNNGVPAAEVAEAAGMKPDAVERAYRMIDSKRSTTRYLHLPPILIETALSDQRSAFSSGI